MSLICQSVVFQPRGGGGIDKAALQSFPLLFGLSKRKMLRICDLLSICLLSLHRWPAGRKEEESASIMFSLRVVEIEIKVSNFKCFVFDLARKSDEQGLKALNWQGWGPDCFCPTSIGKLG